MSFVRRSEQWRTKPDRPVEVDWRHPLARGLRSFWVLGEGVGLPYDAARGTPATASGATWEVGPRGRRLARGTISSTFHLQDSAYPTDSELNAWRLTYVLTASQSGAYDAYLVGRYGNTGTGAGGLDLWMWGDGTSAWLGISAVGGGINWTGPTYSFPGVHDIGYAANGGTVNLYRDGESLTSLSASVSAPGGATTTQWVGNRDINPAVERAALWGRTLSADELRVYHREPYALLRPARRRLYLFAEPGEPVFEGSAEVTVPVPQIAATGAAAAPAFTGSGAIAVPLQTLAAAAAHLPPEFGAAADLVLPMPTIAAAAETTAPVFAGEAAIAVPVQQVSATASFAERLHVGDGVLTIPMPAVAATAAFAIAGRAAEAVLALPMPALAAAAAHTPPIVTAEATVVFAVPAIASEARFAPALFQATAALTLPMPAATAEASHLVPPRAATAAVVVPMPRIAATAFQGEPSAAAQVIVLAAAFEPAVALAAEAAPETVRQARFEPRVELEARMRVA